MAELLFYFLGGDFVIFSFFAISLYILLDIERKRSAGHVAGWVPGRVFVLGVCFWTLGMLLDAVRRIEVLESLRIFEVTFKFAGNVSIMCSAYSTHRRLGGYAAGSKGGVQ